eukprot:5099595-Pyramimonas_sp.AAC.1
MYWSIALGSVKSTASGVAAAALSSGFAAAASAPWASPPAPLRLLMEWCSVRSLSAASRAALPASVADLSTLRACL